MYKLCFMFVLLFYGGCAREDQNCATKCKEDCQITYKIDSFKYSLNSNRLTCICNNGLPIVSYKGYDDIILIFGE